MIKLTGEQQDVILAIVEGIRRKGLAVQSLGGLAGTGKTTVVSYLMQVLDRFAACSLTGKAANVLRRKGVRATTIHSLIYKPRTEPDGAVTFQLAPNLDCEGIIVDEASMVSVDLDADLRSFGLPILYVGDHGQLPPIGEDLNLMADPMYRLERIHRNAGPIARFCHWVREGGEPRRFPTHLGSGQIQFMRHWDLSNKLLTSVDHTICAYNRTRQELNRRARAFLGLTGVVQEREKVMCLRNNHLAGIFNGMQGYVRRVWKEKRRHFMDFDSGDMVHHRIQFDPAQFGEEKTITPYTKDGPIPFDYAYAGTAQKSQGDEWNNVVVFEQLCKRWDHIRWCYTAGSRARENLLWCA